jgi:hypothetical protein
MLWVVAQRDVHDPQSGERTCAAAQVADLCVDRLRALQVLQCSRVVAQRMRDRAHVAVGDSRGACVVGFVGERQYLSVCLQRLGEVSQAALCDTHVQEHGSLETLVAEVARNHPDLFEHA